jgi:hypothetical protein
MTTYDPEDQAERPQLLIPPSCIFLPQAYSALPPRWPTLAHFIRPRCLRMAT